MGSDVLLKNPDRNVSTFAMKLIYAESLGSHGKPSHGIHLLLNLEPTN